MLSMCAIVNISKTMLRISYILLYSILCISIFATAESKIGRFDPVLVFQIFLTLPFANFLVFLIYELLSGFGAIFPSFGVIISGIENLRPWGWHTAFYYLFSGVAGYLQWFYLFPKIGEKLSARARRKADLNKTFRRSDDGLGAPLGALARFAGSAQMLYMSWWIFAALL